MHGHPSLLGTNLVLRSTAVSKPCRPESNQKQELPFSSCWKACASNSYMFSDIKSKCNIAFKRGRYGAISIGARHDTVIRLESCVTSQDSIFVSLTLQLGVQSHSLFIVFPSQIAASITQSCRRPPLSWILVLRSGLSLSLLSARAVTLLVPLAFPVSGEQNMEASKPP